VLPLRTMLLGNPRFGCEPRQIDFAKAAEAMGGRGFTIRVDAAEPMMPRRPVSSRRRSGGSRR
jgi:hypothetical protein